MENKKSNLPSWLDKPISHFSFFLTWFLHVPTILTVMLLVFQIDDAPLFIFLGAFNLLIWYYFAWPLFIFASNILPLKLFPSSTPFVSDDANSILSLLIIYSLLGVIFAVVFRKSKLTKKLLLQLIFGIWLTIVALVIIFFRSQYAE